MSIDYDAIMDKDYDEIQRLREQVATLTERAVFAEAYIKPTEQRLEEAERLLRVAHDCLYANAKSGWSEETRGRINAFLRPADSASVVQPEGRTDSCWFRCCVDYPRCDCNSPPEPDNAPALQPCGHPWKAQHDFKCILCSSPKVTP